MRVQYFIWILIFVFLGSCKKQKQAQSTQTEKPNIIFVLVDDMGWGDLGVFYQNKRRKDEDASTPWQATPNLDELAMSGVRLPHHYASAPVCAPSRASLLSGLSQGHAKVRDNQFDKALADNHTMARVLSEAGYTTAAFGKWGLQGKKGPNGWPAHPLNRGFDYFLGYMRHIDGHEHYPKEAPYSNSKQVWKNRTNITPKLDKTYTADLWTAGTKHWIIKHEKKKDDQPFFVYLAYDTPHAVLELPTQAYPKGGGLEGGLQWLGEPGHMLNTSSDTVDSWVYPRYAKATYDHDNDPSTPQVHWPKVYQRYATSVRRIDSGVGDIVQLLKDLGIRENTLIVFTSDNGPSRESYLPKLQPNKPTFFKSYGPFDGIKRDVWEGGIRMPTFASWPGHIPGKSIMENPSANYDWLATFADAAGVPVPANSDGVTLLPALTGKEPPERGLVYVEYYHPGKTPAYEDFASAHRGRRRNHMQMLRTGDYVGVRYNIQSAKDDFAIYNIIKDPGQEHNLAKNSHRPAFFDSLQQRMKAMVLWSRRPNKTATRPYDDALLPPVTGVETEPGVQWKAFEGKFPWLPKVKELTADRQGYVKRPNLDVNKAKKQVLYFTGYIRVPKDGTYTFGLKIDTAALLRLHKATVIDAGYGYQSGSLQKAKINLEAGLHPFRLYYMTKGKSKPMLKLQWSGPGISLQSIPADVFFRKARK